MSTAFPEVNKTKKSMFWNKTLKALIIKWYKVRFFLVNYRKGMFHSVKNGDIPTTERIPIYLIETIFG